MVCADGVCLLLCLFMQAQVQAHSNNHLGMEAIGCGAFFSNQKLRFNVWVILSMGSCAGGRRGP